MNWDLILKDLREGKVSWEIWFAAFHGLMSFISDTVSRNMTQLLKFKF